MDDQTPRSTARDDDTANPTDAAPAEEGTSDWAAGGGSTPGGRTGTSTDPSLRWKDAATQAKDAAASAGNQARERLEPLVAQLQTMIDNLSTQAEPRLREIAAKAAELAAVAGERAGPIAAKAAEQAGNLGERVAAKGKEVAADIRRGGNEPSSSPPWASETADPAAVGSVATDPATADPATEGDQRSAGGAPRTPGI